MGHPGTASQVIGYVLQRAPAAEQMLIDEEIERALSHFESMLGGNLEPAMKVLHTRSRVDEASREEGEAG